MLPPLPLLQSHLLCPPISLNIPPSFALTLSFSTPHSFTASPDTGGSRPRVCNLVLITTSDQRCDLHPSASRDSQEGHVNVRPEVITVITACNRSPPAPRALPPPLPPSCACLVEVCAPTRHHARFPSPPNRRGLMFGHL